MNEIIAQLLPALATIKASEFAEAIVPIGSNLEKDDWNGLLYGIEELAQNGRADLAEQLMSVCLQVAKDSENDWAVRAVMYFLGHVYYLQEQFERAIGAYQAVVKSSQHSTDEEARFQASLALSSISQAYLAQGYITQAIKAIKLAVREDEKLDWRKGVLGDRLQLAGMYLVQEEFVRAKETLRQAMVEARAIHDQFWIALVSLRMATMQEDLENPGAALDYYQAAREALDAIEEPEDEDLYEKAYRDLFIGLGTAYQELGASDQAIMAFSNAARLANVLEDKRSQAVVVTWLGSAQVDAGRPELALRSYNAAERLARAVDYAGWIGTIYFLRASAWQALGRFDEAQTNIQKAIQWHRTIAGENSPDEAGYLIKLGQISLEKGDLDGTVAYYQQALNILHEIGVSQMHRIIYLRLGEAYWYRNEYLQAYEMLRKALDIYESRRQTISDLWERVDFGPSRDLVYEYLVQVCLALDMGIDAFQAVEEGRMRVFREQLAVQPVMQEPVEMIDWPDIKSLVCLKS